MVWIIILTLLFLLLCWLFISPLECTIDTRVPVAVIRWISIGKAAIVFEKEEWWMKVNILFFHRKWTLEKLFLTQKRKPVIQKQERKRKGKLLKRILHVFQTFKIKQWQIAIDSEDSINNALFYPLNFLPYLRQHIYINFTDQNYVTMTIRNVPWRIIYAWLK